MIRSYLRWILPAALAVIAISGYYFMGPPHIVPRDEIKIRPCRADVFFLDFRTQMPTPAWSEAQVQAIREQISRKMRNLVSTADFSTCGAGSCTELDARLEFLLGDDSYLGSVLDAKHRFFRLIYRNQRGEPLRAADAALCKIVGGLRNAFVSTTSIAWDAVSVGRECEARALAGVEPIATDAMMTWHLVRTGRLPAGSPISAVDLTHQPPEPGAKTVIALIDGGVDSTLAAQIGISERCVRGPAGECPAAHPLQHGAAMALLLRQMTRSALIRSYQVLNEQGEGTVGDVAVAIDRALLDAKNLDPDQTPLVINLSLGWPPELALQSALEAGGCRTTEDNAGEAPQYLLEIAHRRRGRPTFAAGASGNRPGDYRHLPTFHNTTKDIDLCAADSTGGFQPRMFFPGWYYHGSCIHGDSDAHPLVLASHAIDDHGRYGVYTMLNSNIVWPYVAAPGQHVYVWRPQWRRATATDRACPPKPRASGVTGLRLPAAFSGTSVSAAMISGTAAEVLSRLRAQHPGLAALVNQKRLTALLQAAALLDSTPSPEQQPLYVLSHGRLDYALSHAGTASAPGICHPWLQCELTNGSYHVCKPLKDACFADAGAEPTVVPPSWPPNYPACAPLAAPANLHAMACSEPSCPPSALPYRTSFGSTGPQPEEPICNECKLTWEDGSGVLVIDISSAFGTDIDITDPTLVVEWNEGQTHKVATVDLSGYEYEGEPVRWEPGLSIELDIPGAAFTQPNIPNWEQATAHLKSTLDPPQGDPMVDISPLHLELSP